MTRRPEPRMPEPPWRSAPRRPRVPRPQLSREVVVAAALDVVEKDGGDALTMRRVADQIGVSASSLYGYVTNKEELVQLVLDRIFEEVELPQAGGSWQDEFKGFGRSLLRVFRRHPGVAALTLGRVVVGPSMLDAVERSLADLRAVGMPDVVSAYVGDLLSLYVGAIAYEMDMTPADAEGDFGAQFTAWLKSLPRARFPNIIEMAGMMAAGDADDRFEWGLDVIIRGLATYLDTPPTADAHWPGSR